MSEESEGSYQKEQALLRTVGEEVEEEFKWKDRDGGLHKVADMKTKHLFHTLRMIWNHSAPEEMKFKPYQRYKFGPHYTPKYVTRAVREMIKELRNRKDLTLDHLNVVHRMLSYLETPLLPRLEIKG